MKTSIRPPSGVNLIAFASRFQHLLEPCGVSTDHAVAADRPRAPPDVALSQRPTTSDRRLRDDEEVDRMERQMQRARDDAENVQQIVDDPADRPARYVRWWRGRGRHDPAQLPRAQILAQPSTAFIGVRSSWETSRENRP